MIFSTWRQWLRRFAQPIDGRPRRKLAPGKARPLRAHFQPQIEQLETRDLPALTIIPTFAANILADPQAAIIEATINTTIQNYESIIADPITVNITYQEMPGGLGMSNWGFFTVPYTNYLAALTSHATSANDATALATLPPGPNNPVNGSASINIQAADYVALGLGAAAINCTISINTSICNLSRALPINPANYDLEAVVEHETDECLEISSALSGLPQGSAAPVGGVWGNDLFRYSAPGVRSFDTNIASTAFFSINGGVTDLAQYNQDETGDMNDWYSVVPPPVPQIQDAFGTPGSQPNLGVELTVIDVTGYTLIDTLVSLTAGNLTIGDTQVGGNNDSLTIQANTALNEYIITDPNKILGTFGIAGATTSANYHTVTVPFAAVTGTQVIVNQSGANDALTLDYSLGNFPQTVNYIGGTGTDTFTVENGTFANETYTYTSATSGTVNLAGQMVTFVNVTSLADTTTGGSLAFTLPASVVVTLLDDGNPNNGISEITGAAIVPTTFLNPATSLTVTTAGGSTVQLDAMDNGFKPTSEVFSGLASDTYRLNNVAAIASQTSVTVTLATLDLNGLSPTINGLNGNGIITNNQAAAATLQIGAGNAGGTFSGIIRNGAGGIALTKQGTGNQILSGANTYSGTTDITAGLLTDGIVDALPITTALIDGGTFDLGGFNQQVATITGSGIVTDSAAAAAFTVANGAPDIFNGILTGPLSLIAAGIAVLTLNTANTYLGSTTINVGATLQDGAINALPATTALTVNGTLDLHGFSQSVSAVSGSGSVTDTAFTAAFTVTNTVADLFNGTFTVSVSLVAAGAAPLTLAGASSNTGSTTINGGAAIYDGIANALSPNTIVNDNGTLDLKGFNQQVAGVTGGGTVTNSSATAATFTVNNSAADSFAGALTGNLALTKIGAGVLNLSGATNSYTGATAINVGAIFDGAVNALPIGTALTVAGTLDLNGFNQQVRSVTGPGTVTDSNAAANFTVNNIAADVFAGTLAGNLNLVAAGVALTLNSANTYTGSTTINGGATIKDGIANALPTATTLNVAGTLDLNGFNQQVAAATGNGVVTNSSATAATFTIADGAADALGANLTGNLGLTKSGGGALTLSGAASNYTGATTISTGTIADGVVNALPSGTALNVAGNLDLHGFNQQVASVTGAGSVTNTSATAATFTVNNIGADGFGGTLSANLALTKTNGGTLTLTNVNSYTGATTISAGIVVDGGASALPTGTALADGGTLDLNGFNLQVASVTGNGTVTNSSATAATFTVNDGAPDLFGGALIANLALTKTGAGTLTLSGASTYAGATAVSNGALIVNGSITANVTVASSATLGGDGSTGTVTVQSTGALYPATTVNTLSTGALNLQAGGAFNVGIAGSNTYSNDNVTSGAVNLATTGAGVPLNVDALGGFVPTIGAFIIVNNSAPSAQPINGEFVAGAGIDNIPAGTPLAEGALLSTNFLGSGLFALMTYQAGPNNDSAAILTVLSQPMTYVGTAATNNFLLIQVGAFLDLYDNAVLVKSQRLVAVSSVNIGVAAGDDAALTIDYSGGQFTKAVTFDGGSTGPGVLAHTLTLQNGSAGTQTFTYTGPESGNVAIDIQTAAFTDVTSIADTTPENNLVVNLPSGANASLQDDAVPANGISEIAPINATFAPTTFADPTNAFTVATGGGGSSVQLEGMDSGFSPATETFSGSAGDLFQYQNATAVPDTTALTVTAATLDLDGFNPTVHALNGTGIVTDNAATASILTVGFQGGSGTFKGIIKDGSSGVSLTKISVGVETLAGANAYSGPTTVSGGTFQLGAANAVPNTSDVTDNATLDLHGFSDAIGALAGNGAVTSSAGGFLTLTVGATGNDGTFAGVLQNASANSLAVTKTGAGTQIFNNASNTYSGGTTVSNGILQLGDGATNGSAGSGNVTIASLGTLQFDSDATSTAASFLFANVITGAGAISVISQNSGNLGPVKVTANNSGFTGALDISGGSYVLGGNNALGSPSGINISGTGQFYFGSATSLTVKAPVTVSTLGYADGLGAIRFSGAADVLADPVVIIGTALISAYQTSGAITGPISGGTLDVGSGLAAETIVLTGSNSYGSTTINASATLQIGNGGAAGSLGTGAVNDGGQLAFDRSDKGVTVNDNIVGSGSLAQIGSGTLILPATNTYSYAGPTTVSNGVLQADGALSSSVTLSGTGTLTGSGSVAGVTGQSGTLESSDAGTPGILTTGPVSLQTGAALSAVFAGSTNYGQDNVASGTVAVAGAALNLLAAGTFTPAPALGDVYTLINNNGGAAISGLLGAGAGVLNFAAGTPLPEGADLTDNFLGTGKAAILTYQGGPNSDNVALLIRGKLNYTGTQTVNNFLLIEDGLGNLDIYDNNILKASQAAALTTSVNINVAANTGASLTIDYSGGQFTNNVTFSGGASATGHTLLLQNGSFNTQDITFTGPSIGSINLDGQTIGFANVAALNSYVPATNDVFDLASGDQGTLQNGGPAPHGYFALVGSAGSFVTTTLTNPAGSVRVNTHGGKALVNLGAMDSSFNPASEIFTGLSGDIFKLNGWNGSPTIAVTLDAHLEMNGDNLTVNGLVGTGTIVNSTATPATLTVGAGGGSGAFSGSITTGAGTVALLKTGSGTETLSGTNTYAGVTTISGGVLQLGAANAFSAASDVTDNATLDVNGFSASVGALTGGGSVTNSAAGVGVLTVGADGHSGTFAGAFIGAVGLTKTGAGMLTLAGPNTYSGPTTISAGTLQLGAAFGFSGNSDVADGATLDLHGYSGAIGALTGKGTVTNSSSTPATLTFGADGANGAFAGVIKNGAGTGTVGLNKAGAGVQSLSGVNTYTGLTTINAGTLQLGAANTIPAASDVTDNSFLDLNHFNDSIGALTGFGTVTNSAALASVLTVGANGHSGVFSGGIQNGAGAVGVTKIGAGTEAFASAGNSYSGPTLISAGTLQAGFVDCFSMFSDVTDNATLDLHGYGVITGSLTGTGAVTTSAAGLAVLTVGGSGHSASFAGTLKNGAGVGAGTLGFGKTGAGTQTLTGLANSFTGAVDLTGGTLTVQDTLITGVILDGPNVTLNGAGVVRGQVIVSGSDTHIDGVTIAAQPNSQGIVVDAGADFTQIGIAKGITVSGGNSGSTGILVFGSALIFNSKISGHNVDVNVDGGSAVLQGDTLNAGTGASAAGLEVDNFGIADAGQLSSDATPLPGGPAGNVGFYGDITGLFSGAQLGSTAHSAGGNIFDGYTASAITNANPTVPQAIRDLNTGAALFSTLTNEVETSFTYGGGPQLGRMDVTARNDTFNNVLNPTSAVIAQLVVDEHRQANLGFVVFGLPSLTISQTPVPQFVPPGAEFGIIISYANTGTTPTFGVIKEYLSADQTFNASANPGWVYQGNGLATFNLGLLAAGASGAITFVSTVVAQPPSATVSLTTDISFDISSGINLDAITVTTKTTAAGVFGRLG